MSAQTKPALFANAIILSNTVAIDFGGNSVATRGLYVGSGGDISVEMAGDNLRGGGMADATVVFVAVQSGTILPISVTRVNSTGTTASNLVALW